MKNSDPDRDLNYDTDLEARRYRALRTAGKSIAADVETALELVATIRREIRRLGLTEVREARLRRAVDRVDEARARAAEHDAKVRRYLPPDKASDHATE